MAVNLKKYQLRLNSSEKIETLLQELYNEACKNIEAVQLEMNKLSNSMNLNDETTEAKAKYAKAMNDYITNKDKAIGRKLEIAKLMSEILKYNGNVKQAFQNTQEVGNWDSLLDSAESLAVKTPENNREEYRLK